MFIRETIKVDSRTSKKYTSHQLVESYRTHKGPRQRILLTIGSEISLSKSERKELANRIDEIIQGSSSLFTYPMHIDNLAQHYAKLLFQKNEMNEVPSTNEVESDFETLDINSISHDRVQSIGVEHVALSAYLELDFDNFFDKQQMSTKQKRIAAAAIIGRAIYPSSERTLQYMLQNESGLDSLLDTSFANLSLDSLYRVADNLYKNKRALERHLRNQERSLFNLDETIILYDISNTYFEGGCKQHPKAARGKSKEMRLDCPLLSIGVVLDSEGFPKHSEFFEGNVNERSTLQEMIAKLDLSKSTKKSIIVLDSGIATKDNVQWLKEKGYHYIVMMKKKDRPSAEACQEVIIRDSSNQYITATLENDDESGDYLLRCYSELRKKKEQDIKKHKEASLEGALCYLRDGLSKPNRIKKLDKVHEKIGRLREKHARLAQHYNITVHSDHDNKIAQDITWEYNQDKVERSFSGTYTLRTNIKDLSAEKIWEIYVMLSEAESCFRCLKSETGFRPNWHKREDRINSHMFISLLAYHLIVTTRKKLKTNDIHDSWETIRNKLRSHSLVKTSVKTKDGKTIYLSKASEPNENQKNLYKALKLSFKPLRDEKNRSITNVVSKKN